MAKVLGLFAKKANNSMTYSDLLPSPTNVEPSYEQIWSEDTGRAQSGKNQAQMVGDPVAEKKTYAVSWDMLTEAQFTRLRNKLPMGFFYFGLGTQDTVTVSKSVAPSGATQYYRSEITSEIIKTPKSRRSGDPASGVETRYRNVKVSIIER